jgi:hypothetical protein
MQCYFGHWSPHTPTTTGGVPSGTECVHHPQTVGFARNLSRDTFMALPGSQNPGRTRALTAGTLLGGQDNGYCLGLLATMGIVRCRFPSFRSMVSVEPLKCDSGTQVNLKTFGQGRW